jgi:hypothetical protein
MLWRTESRQMHPALVSPSPPDPQARAFLARVGDALVALWPLTAPDRDIVAELSAFLRSYADGVASAVAASAELGCRAGCAWCCTVQVTATAPEIFALARHIRAEQPALIVPILRESIVTVGLDPAAHAALRRWCPLLDADRNCSVYDHRPTACRAVMAPDAAYCRDSFEGKHSDFRYFIQPMTMNGWLASAVMAALHGRGLAADKYELNHALAIALGDRDAESLWRAGQDPLAPARATSNDERQALDMLAPTLRMIVDIG